MLMAGEIVVSVALVDTACVLPTTDPSTLIWIVHEPAESACVMPSIRIFCLNSRETRMVPFDTEPAADIGSVMAVRIVGTWAVGAWAVGRLAVGRLFGPLLLL